ncbi:WAPL (Wings apart-like protein regulation of heterochromatin) protein [Actinidia rufa]|uniref:WAPL (Wings apart-like protein regulation of heterochromatin) protein n=1 Tax=Actinidia rufa TaxID=165716 RepID=A0A7J0FY18_9ERIC|nr:WAPL (Wings apart-like protein regulation of heterochromatin) protein [Actinidia rufa]
MVFELGFWERWLEESSFSSQEPKENADLESLELLLKCLKIMENATFLSKDNQSHLLEMKGNFDHQGSPRSFTKLILSVVKILSGLSLSRSSSRPSDDYDFCDPCSGTDHASEIPLLLAGHKVDGDKIISISSKNCSSTEWTSSQKSLSISQNSRWLSNRHSGISKSTSETTTASEPACLLKMRPNSSTSGSSSGTPVDNNVRILSLFMTMNLNPPSGTYYMGDSKFLKLKTAGHHIGKIKKGVNLQLTLSQQESTNWENHHSDASCSSAHDEEKSNLLADCLLTAIKVLMNLTNDNPVGCQQIAACGGLETLSSLIAGHFPSFSSYFPPFSERRENTLSSNSNLGVEHENDTHLSDQELDFLVAILGLLVNLVEKDSLNRSRLAAVSVSLPSVHGPEEERHGDVIPLLCSIFLANQGAGEAAGEGPVLSWDDETALLQGAKEAEKMIVEAYAALLLAFLSTESKSIRNSISECLPGHNLAILVPVLERFVVCIFSMRKLIAGPVWHPEMAPDLAISRICFSRDVPSPAFGEYFGLPDFFSGCLRNPSLAGYRTDRAYPVRARAALRVVANDCCALVYGSGFCVL